MTKMRFLEPIAVEALAAFHVIKFSCNMGLYRIILKSDSLEVVKMLKSNVRNWSRYRHLVEHSKNT